MILYVYVYNGIENELEDVCRNYKLLIMIFNLNKKEGIEVYVYGICWFFVFRK